MFLFFFRADASLSRRGKRRCHLLLRPKKKEKKSEAEREKPQSVGGGGRGRREINQEATSPGGPQVSRCLTREKVQEKYVSKKVAIPAQKHASVWGIKKTALA